MNDLADVVDRATAQASWDPARLVADAARTGRSRVRRRRAGAVLVACVVVAGAGAGWTSTRAGVEVDRAAEPRASVSSEPSAPTNQHRRIAPGPEQTGRLLAQVLRTEGVTSTDPVAWQQGRSDHKVYQAGSVLVDGAEVTIMIKREFLSRCGEQPAGAACDSVGDGFEWTSTAEPAPTGGPVGIVSSYATLFTPDHYTISATAYSAAGEEGVSASMTHPVLSEAQLSTVVEDPAWLTP